jgi:outer membrane protein
VKNLSLILNIVLLAAVLVLYILHFTSGKDQTPELSESSAASFPVNIAYINSDTLLENYEFSKVAAGELENKQDELQAEYENRARGLQTEIQNFQRNAQNMTMAQARAIEEDLTKKQQNLIRYQESLSQTLMQQEAKISNELYDKVADYLQDYGLANNYQLVLTYQKGSGVLYANDSLNITRQVVDGLNQAYQQEEPKETDTTSVQ